MNSLKIEIKWAIVFTIMTMVWMMVEKFSGLHDEHIEKHVFFTNFYAVPAIAVYVGALLDKKRNFYHGRMSYIAGFKSGLWLTAFATMLAPINQYIITMYLTPDFFPNAISYAVASGNLELEAAEHYFSLKNYVIQSLVGTPIMGIITSAVVALFIKSK